MYQNSNMWDRLRVCAVGRSWPVEFYNWIVDPTVRHAMERIAEETEEDYQQLINCLHNNGVNVIRPIINTDPRDPILQQIITQFRPPMCPGDDLIMLGTSLVKSFSAHGQNIDYYNNIVDHIAQQGNTIVTTDIDSVCGASIYQLGSQILFTLFEHDRLLASNMSAFIKNITQNNNVHRMHQFEHIDGWFIPVTPGLIVSTSDPQRPELLSLFFDTYFPGWEIVTLPPTLVGSHLFQSWREHHSGSWWVPGQEHNSKFIDFVDQYFTKWIGNVQETVFDLNMIVIDKNNVIVSHFNQEVFDAFKRYDVTPHLVPLRHANFWDGGVHCVITELDRKN